jgi:hypothetical protein
MFPWRRRGWSWRVQVAETAVRIPTLRVSMYWWNDEASVSTFVEDMQSCVFSRLEYHMFYFYLCLIYWLSLVNTSMGDVTRRRVWIMLYNEIREKWRGNPGPPENTKRQSSSELENVWSANVAQMSAPYGSPEQNISNTQIINCLYALLSRVIFQVNRWLQSFNLHLYLPCNLWRQ